MTYALVSGATGVLGKEFCFQLAKQGKNLFLTGRNEDKLIALKNSLTAEYPAINAVFCACDLSCDGQVKNLLSVASNYTFDTLINAAGADIQKPFDEYSVDKVIFQIRATFESSAVLTSFVLGHRAESLKILNISSVCALRPMPYFALYAASKSAQNYLSVALSHELKREGVTVTSVLPGSIRTREDIKEYIDSLGYFARRAAKSPQWVVQKSLKALNRGRRKVILGAANKFLAFILLFVPKSLQYKFIARKWRKTRKDAF